MAFGAQNGTKRKKKSELGSKGAVKANTKAKAKLPTGEATKLWIDVIQRCGNELRNEGVTTDTLNYLVQLKVKLEKLHDKFDSAPNRAPPRRPGRAWTMTCPAWNRRRWGEVETTTTVAAAVVALVTISL